MKLPHPIPYQGSKRNIAGKILTYFPDDIDTLYESFVGSAAMTIAAAKYNKANSFVLNDINKPLMDIWEQILTNPLKLSNDYRMLWEEQLGNEKEFYKKVRNEFNQDPKAHQLLYLLARCVKNAVRYNDKGEFNQGPDNRRKGRQPSTMQKEILGASNILAGKTSFYVEDYVENVRRASKQDLVYLDPPYQGTRDSSKRYIQGLDLTKFINCLHDMNERGISYIISFDGKTGEKTYGEKLPDFLELTHIEIEAGVSSQSTLLGKNEKTIESIYLSRPLVNRLLNKKVEEQLALFGG
ncbi:Dam family site-specific DNA-(adenine-N6)-methyltransferase [Fictibacillus halophilus]|uniref:Dam family site-specific DNA-(adenine-N6)-methyltransferase n=1 Tax=Fictibacillus halophilus TaxID=1610490 RepID=UPI003644B02E